MQLEVTAEGECYTVEVPEERVREAAPFFDRMDRDMDGGWQVGAEWMDSPDPESRCKVVAEKLWTALHSADEPMQQMMAGYILSRMPQVTGVRIHPAGDVQGNELVVG